MNTFSNSLDPSTKYALVLTGHRETTALYLAMAQMGFDVVPIYIESEWVFPEVRDYIHALAPIIDVPVKHRFSELLAKRGWPIMRSRSQMWHIRELQMTVDRYLKAEHRVEVVPFTPDTKESAIRLRKKRTTPFVTPLLTDTIHIEPHDVHGFYQLAQLRDRCESHYLVPLKGFMYSSLRPKFELEILYNVSEDYYTLEHTNRTPTTIETVWPTILELDGTITKRPAYFNGYDTVLDMIYEFNGKRLDKPVVEVVEKPIETGRIITMEEFRRSRIQTAIRTQSWMWAHDSRRADSWYPVKPLEFSQSGKTVKVIPLEGKGHEKYISFTNVYSRAPENYFGKQ